jgi:hypothetical protein
VAEDGVDAFIATSRIMQRHNPEDHNLRSVGWMITITKRNYKTSRFHVLMEARVKMAVFWDVFAVWSSRCVLTLQICLLLLSSGLALLKR